MAGKLYTQTQTRHALASQNQPALHASPQQPGTSTVLRTTHVQPTPIGQEKGASNQPPPQCTPPNVTRVYNLTNKPLPPDLTRVLNMGPKFALSRPINKRVMEDAEIGLERGAFALRWRFFIESKKADIRQVAPENTSKSSTQLPNQTGTNGEPTHPPAPSCTIIPRFSDTDTKMALVLHNQLNTILGH